MFGCDESEAFEAPTHKSYGSPAAADDMETSTAKRDLKGLARGAVMQVLRRYSEVVTTSDLSRLISSRRPHENWDCPLSLKFQARPNETSVDPRKFCHARVEIKLVVGRVRASASAMAK